CKKAGWGREPKSGGWGQASVLTRQPDSGDIIGHAGEPLRDMAGFDPPALPKELAGDVEQTAEIPGQNRLGVGGGNIACLVGHHLIGNFRIFDAEGAAKATAYLGSRQLPQG